VLPFFIYQLTINYCSVASAAKLASHSADHSLKGLSVTINDKPRSVNWYP
jgi:hypothetical protein